MVAAVLTIVSMGVLTWKGATAKEALASEVVRDVPHWIKQENLPNAAVPGAKLFAVAGCTACHTYAGSGGSSNLGAPDLTAIGTRNLGIALPDQASEVPVVRQRRARRCRRSPRSATSVCASSRSSSKPPRARTNSGRIPRNARLPRDHGSLRRAVRGAAARGARGGRLRDRGLRVARRDRGARDRALRRPGAAARRDARPAARARDRRRDASTTRRLEARRTPRAPRRSTRT